MNIHPLPHLPFIAAGYKIDLKKETAATDIPCSNSYIG